MDPDRFRRIGEVYSDAVDRDPSEQRRFLDKACGSDLDLRAEVESLLAADRDASGFMARPASHVAAGLIASESRAPEEEIPAGRRIASYTVLKKIGAGGMGTVYLAQDTRLGRNVALKCLQPEFANESGALRRIEAEARAVSALNHPNIITVYDLVESDGRQFIASEFIDGETLQERLSRSRLDRAEILRIGGQVTSALSAAHSAGIVHGDIKPANIMIRADGYVKVLDFGLARPVAIPSPDGSASAALSQNSTIMGTARYMSPEQLLRKPLDGRTDLFSLGVVLYEMAAGVTPFRGDTDPAIWFSLLNEPPAPIRDKRSDLPHALERIIERALQKDPERRYQTASELARDLEKVAADSGKRFRLRLALGTVAAGLAILALWFFARPSGRESGAGPWPPTTRFSKLTSNVTRALYPRISPDGKTVYFAADARGNWDIYSQPIDGGDVVNLTQDSPLDDTQPALSPDGTLIAFRSSRDGGGIFVMSAQGRDVRRLSDFGYNPSWSPDGKFIVAATEGVVDPFSRFGVSQIWTVEVATGMRKMIYRGDATQPTWSPHGHRIAFWTGFVGGPARHTRDVATISAAGGDPVFVTNDEALDWSPVWSNDGHYLYFSSVRAGSMNLWRVRIDERTGAMLGKIEPATVPAPFADDLRFSADGHRAVFANESRGMHVLRAKFDPVRGRLESPLEQITPGSTWAAHPDPSPDGKWVAFASAGAAQEDLYVMRPDGSDIRRLTNDAARDRVPRFSPDSRRILFYSDRSIGYNLWWIQVDGSRLESVTSERYAMYGEWSPDGSQISFVGDDRRPRVKHLATGTIEVLPPCAGPLPGFAPLGWSPDGTKLAGQLTDSNGSIQGVGSYDLATHHCEAFPVPGGRWIRWFADSRRVLAGRIGQLYIYDTLSKKVAPLVGKLPSEADKFALSVDNRTLYMDLNIYESDIWLISIP